MGGEFKEPIITDRGLARHVGEDIRVRVTFADGRQRGARGKLIRTLDAEKTYHGQTTFSVQPKKGGKRLNLIPGSTLINYKSRSDHIRVFRYEAPRLQP